MKGYRTKRITLPGGKVIEIVFFAESEEQGREPEDAPELDHAAPVIPSEDPLNLCPSCQSDLVYPVAWEETGDECWSIQRRCPNCEWRGAGNFPQFQVEKFDEALNDGTEDLLASLRNFSRANMEADVESIIGALDGDHIHPMDF